MRGIAGLVAIVLWPLTRLFESVTGEARSG
jgi:hypothetical protein